MYIPHNYYPTEYTGCEPIHPVISWSYVRKMLRALRKGVKIHPILIDGEIGAGRLLAGTHRSAVNDLSKMLGYDDYIDVIDINDRDTVEQILTDIGYDEPSVIYDDMINDMHNDNYSGINDIWDRT